LRWGDGGRGYIRLWRYKKDRDAARKENRTERKKSIPIGIIGDLTWIERETTRGGKKRVGKE